MNKFKPIPTKSGDETRGALAPSEKHRLDQLLDYVTDSVVSRTIVKGKTGTVTLFAFDKGQELSEHSAPFDAMVQVLDGEVTLTIGGKPITATTGETVIMPADIPHGVYATTPFKMLLTMIRG